MLFICLLFVIRICHCKYRACRTFWKSNLTPERMVTMSTQNNARHCAVQYLRIVCIRQIVLDPPRFYRYQARCLNCISFDIWIKWNTVKIRNYIYFKCSNEFFIFSCSTSRSLPYLWSTGCQSCIWSTIWFKGTSVPMLKY